MNELSAFECTTLQTSFAAQSIIDTKDNRRAFSIKVSSSVLIELVLGTDEVVGKLTLQRGKMDMLNSMVFNPSRDRKLFRQVKKRFIEKIVSPFLRNTLLKTNIRESGETIQLKLYLTSPTSADFISEWTLEFQKQVSTDCEKQQLMKRIQTLEQQIVNCSKLFVTFTRDGATRPEITTGYVGSMQATQWMKIRMSDHQYLHHDPSFGCLSSLSNNTFISFGFAIDILEDGHYLFRDFAFRNVSTQTPVYFRDDETRFCTDSIPGSAAMFLQKGKTIELGNCVFQSVLEHPETKSRFTVQGFKLTSLLSCFHDYQVVHYEVKGLSSFMIEKINM